MKKLKTILIIIHVLVIAGCLIWFPFFRKNQFMGTYQSAEDKIFSATGGWNEERGSYYVDELNGNAGVFTCGPYIELKKGVYEVTVYYKSTTDGNIAYAYDDDAHTFARALYNNTLALDSSHTMKQSTFWVNKPLNYFEIRTEYMGSGSLEIKEIVIRETLQTYFRTVFTWLCLLAGVDVVFGVYSLYKKNRIDKNWLITAFTLAGITVLTSVPFFTDGIMTVVDRNTVGDNNIHLMRIVGLAEGLRDGDFPVYIQPVWLDDYGYAMPIFYGDLFLYLPAALFLIGFPLFWVYNFYLLFVNFATVIIAFFCYKGIFKEHKIALICSIISACSVYRVTTMVNYESLGVFTSFAFLPLIAYGMYLICFESKSQKAWIIMALGMTFLLNSHLLTTEITAAAIAMTMIGAACLFFRRESIVAMIKAVACSVLLNIGFLVPMISYMRKELYLTSSNWNVESWQNRGPGIAEHFVLFPGGATERKLDFVLLCAASVFCLLLLQLAGERLNQAAIQYKKMGILAFSLLLIFTWMSTSYFPWDWIYVHLPWTHWLTSTIQEPMRFAQIAEVFGVILLGCTLVLVEQTRAEIAWKQYFTIAVLAVTFLSFESTVSDYIKNGIVWKVYDTAALDTCNIGTKEYLPADADVSLYHQEFATADENVLLIDYKKKGTTIQFTGQNLNKAESRIQVPLVYYWDYHAIDDKGMELRTECSQEKTLQVVLPADYSGHVTISFKAPILWNLAKGISLITAIGLVCICNKNRKKKNESI